MQSAPQMCLKAFISASVQLLMLHKSENKVYALSAGRVGACFRFQPMSPHPSLPLFKEKTLNGLNCLVSCHQLDEGGIALASYNRCLFMWIYEFLLCNPVSEGLSEIPNINQQFFVSIIVVLFIFCLMGGVRCITAVNH